MAPLNFRENSLRISLSIIGLFIFALIANATIIPDDTTIVGDLTVQSTDGIDVNPGSDVDTDLISIGVTGSPKIKWNETQDALQFIEKLILGTNAILTKTVNGSSYTSKMSLDTDTTTDSGGIDITRHGSSDASYGSISLLRSRGTHASPTIVQSGDLISSIVGLGYDGVDYEPAASIEIYSDETPGSNDMPGRIDFKTVSDSSRVLNQVMRIGRRSDVMIGTTTSDSSSILEVQSVTKGSRPFPRMAQTQRDAIVSPATGLSIFNNDFNTFDFYNGSSWLSLLGTTTTQEFSGKTVSGSLKFKESGGGSNYTAFQAPASLTGDVTFTLPDGDGTAGQALKTDGAGTLSWGNASGGSGGINYISNPDAETDTTGYAVYADAAGTSPVDGTAGSANVTWTRSTSTPLRSTGSFLLTKDAANRQGQGASYDFTIAEADKAKVLNIEFEYILSSGTFVAGTSSTDSDVTVWIYDVTNSTLTQPSSYKLLSNSTTISDRFLATFQTASNSTSYRLIFHVGSTSSSAYVLKIDDIEIGPSNYIYGTPITNWQAVTPTFTGLGTVTSIEVYSRRNGDNLEIEGNFTTGTTTGVEARISLNYRGVDVTSAAIPSIRKAGDLSFSTSAAVSGNTLIEPSVAYLTLGSQSASNAGLTKILGSVLGSSQKHSFTASVPIVGWSSSVQTSDSADTRVLSARYTTNAAQSIANATNTIIDFEDVSHDSHGSVTTGASWKFTAGTPGVYSARATVTSTSTGNFAGTEYFELKLYKNGIFYSSKYVSNFTGSSVQIGATHDDDISLIAGDYIDFRVYQTSGSSLPLETAAGYNFVSIKRLSGPSAIAASESISVFANTAATSISTATETIVNGTEVWDTHGAYDSTTGIFTAPISGKYEIDVGVRFSSAAIGVGGVQELYVQKNSDTNIPIARANWSSATVTIMLNGTYSFNLIAGDTLKAKAYNNTTTALSGDSSNYISIKRVGN